MIFSKENNNKNYSVIIIPERGNITKTLKLSTKILKIMGGLIFIFLIVVFFLVIQYFFEINSTDTFYQKDKIIQSLQETNEKNLKKIDSYNKQINDYNKNNSIMKEKLKELKQLEDSIKAKLNKSISLEGINNTDVSYDNVNDNDLLKKMGSEVVNLGELNKKLNTLLYKEQFIPSILPCIGHITSNFGYRKNPFDKVQSDFHPGIDIACNCGTKIYASASGTIIIASDHSGYGNEVAINHGNGIQTIYGHNSKICVHIGQVVKKGELIALSGTTGSSTGPHSHFEIRKNNKSIDPKLFFKKGDKQNVFKTKG